MRLKKQRKSTRVTRAIDMWGRQYKGRKKKGNGERNKEKKKKVKQKTNRKKKKKKRKEKSYTTSVGKIYALRGRDEFLLNISSRIHVIAHKL